MASIFNTSRLAGKNVLVTGASSGIGKETALLFARAGANVVITARRQAQLDEVAAQIRASGVKAAALSLDVRDRTAVRGILSQIPEELQPIDILVNNAGMVFGVDKVGDISDSDIDTMFETNVLGLITLTQVFVKEFKARNAGHIINLGSVAGREPYPGGAIYCATKSAVRSFTVSLTKEVVNTPIRVTEIQPGLVETEFSIVRFHGDQDAAKNVYKGLEPLTGIDIAEEIVWAASRPPHVNIAELFVLPVCQASAQIVHRGPLDGK